MKIKLVNGTTHTNGRIEIVLDGKIGSICGYSFFNDKTADVICRQMKFKGGRRLMMGSYGAGEGKFYLNALRCKGNETSITQCPMMIEKVGESNDADDFQVGLQFRGRGVWYRNYHRSSCWMHQDDAAVQCYDTGLSLICSMYWVQVLDIQQYYCLTRDQANILHTVYIF
jgi:hypothetical protein